MEFECNSCRNTQLLYLSDGIHRLPSRCNFITCKGKKFTAKTEIGSKTKVIDYQIIKYFIHLSQNPRKII